MAHLEGLPETTPVEIWFEDVPRQARDEAGSAEERPGSAVGRRGTRPGSPPTSATTTPICSARSARRGVGAALALPYADTDMMQLHLDEISRNVAEGAHAVLLLDRAGWHTTGKLDMPENITPIFCRPVRPSSTGRECLAISPSELALEHRLRKLRRHRRRRCNAWQNLIAQPQTITSIGMREWAHVGERL